jgi:hypothetical protein
MLLRKNFDFTSSYPTFLEYFDIITVPIIKMTVINHNKSLNGLCCVWTQFGGFFAQAGILRNDGNSGGSSSRWSCGKLGDKPEGHTSSSRRQQL